MDDMSDVKQQHCEPPFKLDLRRRRMPAHDISILKEMPIKLLETAVRSRSAPPMEIQATSRSRFKRKAKRQRQTLDSPTERGAHGVALAREATHLLHQPLCPAARLVSSRDGGKWSASSGLHVHASLRLDLRSRGLVVHPDELLAVEIYRRQQKRVVQFQSQRTRPPCNQNHNDNPATRVSFYLNKT